jgi:16S rRNA (cytosine1402-N4)-methyltransferase
MTELYHIPVMLAEVVRMLSVKEGGLYVDCTLGDGGHAEAILEQGGTVIGIDRDPEAVASATSRLKHYKNRLHANVGRFSHVTDIVGENSGCIDGVLMDLGVSSRMLNEPSRGFSFMEDGPLLMTMGSGSMTAQEVINKKSERDLAMIFREFGEERHAGKIAHAIVEMRSDHSIKTTRELADLVEYVIGRNMPHKSKARIFQALRMYVNEEIQELHDGLAGALSILKSGGRLCVLSYHSVEDRIVKNFMKDMAVSCVCPPDIPVCRCGRVPRLRIISKKALRPSYEEISRNPRARSAQLRVGEKY